MPNTRKDAEMSENGGIAAADAHTLSGPHRDKATAEEMGSRVQEARTLLATSDRPLSQEEIGDRLGLDGTRPMTLLNKMLENGDARIMAYEGRKRLFGPGTGVPARQGQGQGVRRTGKPLAFETIFGNMEIGDTFRVVGKELDAEDHPHVKIRAASGQEFLLPVA